MEVRMSKKMKLGLKDLKVQSFCHIVTKQWAASAKGRRRSNL